MVSLSADVFIAPRIRHQHKGVVVLEFTTPDEGGKPRIRLYSLTIVDQQGEAPMVIAARHIYSAGNPERLIYSVDDLPSKMTAALLHAAIRERYWRL